MLKTDQFSKIGQVLKSNGTDGQVIIRLFSDINEEEPVFIYFDELPVPFFIIVDEQRSSDKIFAHLTDVNSLEDAEELTGKGIFVPSGNIPDSEFEDFTGWKLYSSDNTPAGTIVGIEDIPGNPCLEVRRVSKTGDVNGTFLIPLHEDLITGIDSDTKSLVMQIPEGLL